MCANQVAGIHIMIKNACTSTVQVSYFPKRLPLNSWMSLMPVAVSSKLLADVSNRDDNSEEALKQSPQLLLQQMHVSSHVYQGQRHTDWHTRPVQSVLSRTACPIGMFARFSRHVCSGVHATTIHGGQRIAVM